MEETLGPVVLDGVRVIAMDEFAIHKGHRYATVVVEPATKRVLWVGHSMAARTSGRSSRCWARRGNIEAVVMDMNGADEAELRHQCPKAEIVFDLFHVVAKYGREVIDRVRVDEANRPKHDKKVRKVVKSARWPLLRNRETVDRPEDRVRLDELLAANQALMTV